MMCITLCVLFDLGWIEGLQRYLVTQVIKSKREKLKYQTGQTDNTPRDFLDIMIELTDEESNKSLTDEMLRHNALTFLIAGFDTTGTALTWTLYLLACHPEKQQRAREEAQKVLGSGSSCSWEQSNDLHYITAVIKESLRVKGPVPIIERRALEDVLIGDIIIPKGYRVLLLSGMDNSPDISGKDVLEFKPERHLEADAEDDILPKTFSSCFPFSIGPNSCIGKKLALSEMKVALAFLLRTFKFVFPANHPPIGSRLELLVKPLPSPKLEVSLAVDVTMT